jgi:hypothetical protein
MADNRWGIAWHNIGKNQHRTRLWCSRPWQKDTKTSWDETVIIRKGHSRLCSMCEHSFLDRLTWSLIAQQAPAAAPKKDDV